MLGDKGALHDIGILIIGEDGGRVTLGNLGRRKNTRSIPKYTWFVICAEVRIVRIVIGTKIVKTWEDLILREIINCEKRSITGRDVASEGLRYEGGVGVRHRHDAVNESGQPQHERDADLPGSIFSKLC